MRRSGTAWPWILLVCGAGCGDSVVVARGVTLVSAAQSSVDAGVADAEDAGAEHESPDSNDGHDEPSEHHGATKPRSRH